MRVLEVNVVDDDGSVTGTVSLQPKEIQMLMEFAVNFLLSVGVVAVSGDQIDVSKLQNKLND